MKSDGKYYTLLAERNKLLKEKVELLLQMRKLEADNATLRTKLREYTKLADTHEENQSSLFDEIATLQKQVKKSTKAMREVIDKGLYQPQSANILEEALK